MSQISIIAERLGANLLADNDQWKFRMEIRSESSSRQYIVAQHKTNLTWGCSCMGWKRYHGKVGFECKHLKTMMPSLAALGGPIKGVR